MTTSSAPRESADEVHASVERLHVECASALAALRLDEHGLPLVVRAGRDEVTTSCGVGLERATLGYEGLVVGGKARSRLLETYDGSTVDPIHVSEARKSMKLQDVAAAETMLIITPIPVEFKAMTGKLTAKR